MAVYQSILTQFTIVSVNSTNMAKTNKEEKPKDFKKRPKHKKMEPYSRTKSWK